MRAIAERDRLAGCSSFFFFFFRSWEKPETHASSGMTRKDKVAGTSKVQRLLAQKKRELAGGDEEGAQLAATILSVAAASKVEKAVVVPRRRSSPTDWRKEHSPQVCLS